MSAPTFDQMQAVMQLVRNQMEPPAAEIALAAMQLYCDFHHPNDPETLADWFWDGDSEHSYPSLSDLISEEADNHETGAQFVFEVHRSATLKTMGLIVKVDHGPGGHKSIHYSSAQAAQARLDLVTK